MVVVVFGTVVCGTVVDETVVLGALLEGASVELGELRTVELVEPVVEVDGDGVDDAVEDVELGGVVVAAVPPEVLVPVERDSPAPTRCELTGRVL